VDDIVNTVAITAVQAAGIDEVRSPSCAGPQVAGRCW
jgi:hypothetical protein